jgi:hypothetical protein
VKPDLAALNSPENNVPDFHSRQCWAHHLKPATK